MKDISTDDQKKNIPLVSRLGPKRELRVGNHIIRAGHVTVIGGPCTVESQAQVLEIAKAIKEGGGQMLRGGIFKPLTFPYGDPLARPDLGQDQSDYNRMSVLPKATILQHAERRFGYLKEAAEKTGLSVVSEIMYADTVPMMSKYVDMFQVGYRHMWNMDLIEALAQTDKPLLIKRHYGESLRSLLGVCEHFEARGKTNYAVCERGAAVPHTHNVHSRAVIDIQAIPALNQYAPTVPVFVDPSHSTFTRSYVSPIGLAAIAAGADGLLVDVHGDPNNAWVDPLQALDYKAFTKLVRDVEGISRVLGKNLG